MVRLKSRVATGTQTGSYLQRSGELLGREPQLNTLDAQLERLRRNPKLLSVCEITGLGGMGKSRLLDEVMMHAKDRYPKYNHVVFVSLEGESSSTEVGVLVSLREAVKLNCHLFDAAMRRYWRAVGQPAPTRPSRIERSILGRGAEVGGAFAHIPLPINFAAQIWEKLEDDSERRQRYQESEFKAVDDLREEPQELRAYLPHCLGRDLHLALGAKGHSLAVFYDSYEKQDTSREGAPWLQELIWVTGRGIHMIASREPLRWNRKKWERHTTSVKVAKLPKKESRQMIQQRLGELDKSVEDRLLAISRGTPFYIESSINLYVDLAREKEVEAKDLPSTTTGAVAGLLDHRRAPQRALTTALAAIRVFDRDLYQHMADVLSVELAVLHHRDFVDSFLVERLSGSLYKLHDLLTEVVRESAAEKSVRSVALEAATDHLLSRCQERGRSEPERVLAILQGVLEGWESVADMPRRCAEALIDVAYVLYDAGFSNELMSIASVKRSKPRHSVSLVADYIKAMSTRRVVSVVPGIKKFERLNTRKKRLGRHAHSLALELAYLRELRGNYPRARNDFRRLARMAEPFDPADRTQLRTRLYHADILIMDGEFGEGSRLLQETYEAVGHRDIVNWGELVRHRAHAYRFSFLLEDAVELYKLAIRKASDAPVLTAKLYTNLVESCCWHDPERALKEAVRSVDLNEQIGHQIELAKCSAAKAIALSRQKRFKEASTEIHTAKELAKSTGYPAGLAFALQAEAILIGLKGDDVDGLRTAMSQLARKTRELGTYGHLSAAPLVLTRKANTPVIVQSLAEWFEPEEVHSRIEHYLGI
ncbi:MAG TPA: hypothetical protein VFJ64_12540 [Solirubrobacterales bacterium]|nr:hypothetical protein [Solirubrobacterales bacterium]